MNRHTLPCSFPAVAACIALLCGPFGPGTLRSEPKRTLHSRAVSVSGFSRFADVRHPVSRKTNSQPRQIERKAECDLEKLSCGQQGVYRAVRPLPLSEKYSEHEIRSREEDRTEAALQCAAACSGTVVAGATVPAGGVAAVAVAGGLAGTVAAGKKYESAKKDVKQMRDHNRRSECRGTTQGF
jgi:hypothetical protein